MSDRPPHDYLLERKLILSELARISEDLKNLAEKHHKLSLALAAMQGKIIATAAILGIVLPILVTLIFNHLMNPGH